MTIFSVLLLRNDLILQTSKESKLARKQIKSNQENYDECAKCYFQETELETSVNTFS